MKLRFLIKYFFVLYFFECSMGDLSLISQLKRKTRLLHDISNMQYPQDLFSDFNDNKDKAMY